ncbi:MAG: sugar phosphate isomerase/epimerase [Clostridia bacterium]|nr:sugar phosphate isomerase/epimerase [Clostridia bacterium]
MKIATAFASTVTKLYGAEKGYQLLAEAGFHAVDHGDTMSLYRPFEGLFSLSEEEFIAHFQAEHAAITAAGLTCCQIHLPFPTWPDPNPNAPWSWEEEYAYIKNAFRRSFTAARILNCEYAVLHCAMRCGWEKDDNPALTFEKNMQLFCELLPLAKQNGVKIALENMPNAWIPSALPQSLTAMIDAVGDSENFVACLDTGHANLTGKEVTPAAYVRALGGRLKVLHVHDNDGVFDCHALPFTGVIDWEEFGAALAEINFNGVLSLEALLDETRLQENPAAYLKEFAAAANRVAALVQK